MDEGIGEKEYFLSITPEHLLRQNDLSVLYFCLCSYVCAGRQVLRSGHVLFSGHEG